MIPGLQAGQPLFKLLGKFANSLGLLPLLCFACCLVRQSIQISLGRHKLHTASLLKSLKTGNHFDPLKVLRAVHSFVQVPACGLPFQATHLIRLAYYNLIDKVTCMVAVQ